MVTPRVSDSWHKQRAQGQHESCQRNG